ncbi:hypothetical protein I7I53_03543 [Histoplasma capsulatum var. duboisii H88]|uniref:Uncharacterized protein n=1 Tax=Ajellomyces capsulatus (strain H88) TaxID=544711 RepID=A0A8A1LUI7_AJEC8|nr:hypothetical protein I7I53_03543 [Histoplasma capsulatum var. duboisii H88]
MINSLSLYWTNPAFGVGQFSIPCDRAQLWQMAFPDTSTSICCSYACWPTFWRKIKSGAIMELSNGPMSMGEKRELIKLSQKQSMS